MKFTSTNKTMALILSISGAQMAHAGLLNTTLRGGLNVFAPSYSGQSSSAGKGMIGGAGLEIGFGPASLIVDALYAQRVIEFPSVYTQTVNYLHVPVQAQLSLGMFHISGGGYWAKGLGSVKQKIGSAAPSSHTFASAGIDGTDFGAVAGMGVGIPMGVASASIDLRYNLGMKDVATSGPAKKNRSIDLMVGISF